MLSYCHTFILPYCHIAILSYCHIAILPYCHTAILSYCHTAILSYFFDTPLILFNGSYNGLISFKIAFASGLHTKCSRVHTPVTAGAARAESGATSRLFWSNPAVGWCLLQVTGRQPRWWWRWCRSLLTAARLDPSNS